MRSCEIAETWVLLRLLHFNVKQSEEPNCFVYCVVGRLIVVRRQTPNGHKRLPILSMGYYTTTRGSLPMPRFWDRWQQFNRHKYRCNRVLRSLLSNDSNGCQTCVFSFWLKPKWPRPDLEVPATKSCCGVDQVIVLGRGS